MARLHVDYVTPVDGSSMSRHDQRGHKRMSHPSEPTPADDAFFDPQQLELFERDARTRTRPRTDDPHEVGVARQLGAWAEELVAWAKTLASAAVYATVIVTF